MLRDKAKGDCIIVCVQLRWDGIINKNIKGSIHTERFKNKPTKKEIKRKIILKIRNLSESSRIVNLPWYNLQCNHRKPLARLFVEPMWYQLIVRSGLA